jgi:hypothetical protein
VEDKAAVGIILQELRAAQVEAVATEMSIAVVVQLIQEQELQDKGFQAVQEKDSIPTVITATGAEQEEVQEALVCQTPMSGLLLLRKLQAVLEQQPTF